MTSERSRPLEGRADHQGGQDRQMTNFKTATIESISVSETGDTADTYSGFRLEADYKTGDGPGRYKLPTIYVVDTKPPDVSPQVPGEFFNPGESGTYDMSFTSMGIDHPTTIVVHMGGECDRFDVEESVS